MSGLSIVIAGFGGQGVLFLGKVVAYAGMLDGREVSWLPSYGPEMRGGTANCGVCLSGQPIGSPLITAPDVLIAMNTPSFRKFIGAVKPGGLALVDSSLTDTAGVPEGVRLRAIPASTLCEEGNLRGLANMVLLGALRAQTRFAGQETLGRALEKCVPARKAALLPRNLEAVRLGEAFIQNELERIHTEEAGT